ncbi:SGNH/GDSL hydrolase family protein [Sporomusa termitida]|uniref:GDSL-like Lipase/Acylhydrolase family protein n=1 Tax=Sporomusa termitida TaxID=2377 RepID=A0A517DP07_9FIRM|nr:GDSL-type esterase/lipase family protein [Sporomusa termitida]QDR78996.1 GDSL-like Lipase/Acylhydrolase family protein [Sporomusa termitida]
MTLFKSNRRLRHNNTWWVHRGAFLLKTAGIIVCLVLVTPCLQSALSEPSTSEAHAGELAGGKIRLVWEPIPDAVAYQIVFSNEQGGMSEAANLTDGIVRKEIYTPGVELDIALLPKGETIWWQVRALNLDREPVSGFTALQELTAGEIDPAAPYITAHLAALPRLPLYPVYAWIPVLGAEAYEVQIFSGPIQSGTLKQRYVINGASSFDYYDTDAFTVAGDYWWRVIALDAKGQPVGAWSEAQPFTVQREGNNVAALGDSVTHGGGAISNPPSDPVYDWTSYVDMPVKNLGRSGDTTSTILARFDEDVLPFRPTILVIMGGINDIRGGTPAAEVINNLSQIGEKCRENKITPVFLTLTPVNPALIKRAFNEDTSETWQEEWHKVNEWVRGQAHYVDIAPLFTTAEGVMPGHYATDGLHPDSQGKALIGQAVDQWLRATFGDSY